MLGGVIFILGVSAAQRQFQDRIGACVLRVVADAGVDDESGSVLHDSDGVYRQWLVAIGQLAALVRPDFYVYGAAAARPWSSPCRPACAPAEVPRVSPADRARR